MSPPQRRPAIRAVAFDEVGEAITRLIVVAGSDAGQAARAADFLLAWWNGGDNGHFPVLHGPCALFGHGFTVAPEQR